MRCTKRLALLWITVGTALGCVDLPTGPSVGGSSRSYYYELGLRVRVSGQDIDVSFLVFVEEVLSPDSTRSLMGDSTQVEVLANSDFVLGFPAPAADATIDALVTLSDVALNCSVAGDNPVATQLKARETVRVEFAVTCVAL